MRDASAFVDRLQSLAVTVKDRSGEAKLRLGKVPVDDPAHNKPRAALKVLVRSLNGRLRETLETLQEARSIADAALVAHNRELEGGAAAVEDVAVAESHLAALIADAEEEARERRARIHSHTPPCTYIF